MERLILDGRDGGKKCQDAQSDGEPVLWEKRKNMFMCSGAMPHGDVLPALNTGINTAIETSSGLISLSKNGVIY